MDADRRQELEREVRQRCQAGDLNGATALALKAYGPELYGFLCALERDEALAGDAFSQLGEDVWRGLASFKWDCSLRTWMYTLARNASHRLHRNRAPAQVPLSQAPELAALAEEVRTRTRTFMRSEVKDRFAEIRATLAPEDQALLVLRVDRQLEWVDLARVLSGKEGDEELKRESARLRKRFQLLKEKLIELGRRAGLVGQH
jgi:RNA polymerase sigma-70 factor (ECF subfamily)